jgi:hypothetical protein
MHVIRPGDVKGASIIGVVLLFISPFWRPLQWPPTRRWPPCSPSPRRNRWPDDPGLRILCLGAAGLVPALPRDYLSTYLKIGTIAILALGIAVRTSRSADGGAYQVHRRWRSGYSGRGLPLHLHHHRLRRPVRFPRHHRHRHHPQDDQPTNATCCSWATVPC